MSGIFFVKIYTGTREEILSVLDKYCLCIGNEGGGIADELLDLAEYKIRIPMQSSCESLNAAVSAGIAMYQLKYGLKRL